ncbi:protein O-mannosyl-transferase [Methylomarinovum caldicuralii]|uniref:Protein O-mannosyl-transferase n=1 Tax=Methylomarinovum caldicuralii TaxID=438856 RepID=A0AAU9CDB4_9GAMM|nr:tetratricopeptide repeat protein [Methylomarinovum caldicuralii]BCX80930.1 protein O-mannosyl-transferase [Methylomarinovum caldicuralii]
MNQQYHFRSPVAQLAVIALAVAAAYGHTLDVPFYLDDYLTIETNGALRTWDWHDWSRFSPRRIVATATFALDHHLHGLNPAGYHITNIIIHGLVSWLVWALVRALLRTPALRDRCPSDFGIWLPWVTALVFALHPLQTQAVTYLTQRMASLAALWYLASVWAYLEARLASGRVRQGLWMAFAVVTAGLAFHTKENTVTLPLIWLWLEIVFFKSRWAGMVMVCCLTIGLGLLAAMSWVDHPWLRWLDHMTRETLWFGRGDYLAAQMKVLWWYVRLFFWPVGLRFDYALHQPPAWEDAGVIVAALGHIGVLGAALGYLRRYPVPAFSVLFYYTAQVIESSVIPIRDLVFEHRTYLPNFGLALLTAWILVVGLPERLPAARRWQPALALLLVCVLGWTTWQRNQLWRDPIAFWRENAALTPEGYRPLTELGYVYFHAGREADAKQVAAQLVTLLDHKGWQPGQENLTWSEVLNIALAYSLVGRHEDAARVARHYLDSFPVARAQGMFHLLLGDAAMVQKDFSKAERHYRRSLKYLPENLDAWLSLGEALGAQGRLVEARDVFRTILKHWPGQARARRKLALAEYLLQRRAGSPSR